MGWWRASVAVSPREVRRSLPLESRMRFPCHPGLGGTAMGFGQTRFMLKCGDGKDPGDRIDV